MISFAFIAVTDAIFFFLAFFFGAVVSEHGCLLKRLLRFPVDIKPLTGRVSA